jgi:replicative DNA helicase
MNKQHALPPSGGRLPPEDLKAEQVILGLMLCDKQAALTGLAGLTTEDFFREAHRQVFSAMEAVAAQGDEVSLITVSARLKQEGLADETGGPEYLMALMSESGIFTDIETYGKILRDRSLLRRIAAFGAKLEEKALANPTDAGALLSETVTGALTLADKSGSAKIAPVATGWQEDSRKLHAAVDMPFGVTAARSGIPILDNATGGYGGMYLIAILSEQKAGKTSFSVQTALSSAEQFALQPEANRQRVLVFPLEEGRDSWVRLACCWLARLDTQLSLPGRSHPDQKAKVHQRIDEGHSKLLELPIVIADGVRTTDEVIAAIQVEQQRGDLGLIVVDYLQRLSEGNDERVSLTQTARALQSASEQVKSPLLLSSQMSWSDAGVPLTYGSRGGVFDASLVMSLKRDVDEKKQKRDSGVIKCQWARGIREFGELPYWVSYAEGGRYHNADEEHYQHAESDNDGKWDGPDQTW